MADFPEHLLEGLPPNRTVETPEGKGIKRGRENTYVPIMHPRPKDIRGKEAMSVRFWNNREH